MVNDTHTRRRRPVTLASGSTDKVEELTHLGSVVSTTGGSNQDVDARMGKARSICRVMDQLCKFTEGHQYRYTGGLVSSSFLACNSRLRSAIRRHHPPQRAVLSQICCFGKRKMVMFQILLDGAEPCDAGTTQLSSPVCRRGGQQDPLGTCVVVHAHNMPK